MFWRTLFYGFLLRSHGNIETLYRLSMSTTENISKPVATNPYLLNQSSFFGYDHRHSPYQNTTHNHMVIMNITQFLEKMKLLRELENEKISKNSRLNALREYEKLHEPSPLKFNIFGGGLQNDWSNDEEN
jgi:hypothetical protein